MAEAAERLKVTPAEYLAFERTSEEKHEYVDGEIFAMSGGTFKHALLAQNIGGELGNALLEQPWQVLGSDMRVKAVAGESYHYPDVSVVCGSPLFEDATEDVLLNPKLIVEVLSESSERYDRGAKFARYRSIDTVEDYVLVTPTSPLVEHYHRLPDGEWRYRALGLGDALELPALGCAIPVERIYLKAFPAS
jgi:Uma2 family endonuclease